MDIVQKDDTINCLLLLGVIVQLITCPTRGVELTTCV